MVADGYKQTDFGVIPQDWKIEHIGNICQINGRIGFRGYTVNDIVSFDKGAITISPSNIKNNKTLFNKCTYLSWYKYEESPEIKIYNGDILLVKTGSTVGKTALVKNLKEKATINPQIVVFKKITIDNIYLSYVASDKVFQNQIQKTIVGGAIPTLSQKEVASFIFLLPPKQEQQAIATALSDTDELINSLEKLIAKKEAIKTGTMQELLTGKKRLDGFSGEWEEKTLEEYVSITSGDSPSKFNFHDKGLPYYKVEQLNYSTKYLIENTPYFIESNAKKVVAESIIFPKRGAAIFLNKIRLLGSDAFFDTNLMALTTNDKLSHEFLFYALSYIGLEHVADTTSVPQINNKHINPFVIPFPEIEEQQAISAILSDMDSDIDALKTKLSKVKAIKEGMMQELLTGRTRLIGEDS